MCNRHANRNVKTHNPDTLTRLLLFCLAGLFLALPLQLSAQQPSQQPTPPPPTAGTLRVDVPLVNLYCTVKNKKGALLDDLTEIEFEVFEDGKKQTLRHFERETDRPLTLALLIDTSGSQKRTLPQEKEAAQLFIRQVLRPSDLAMLVTYDVNVDLLQDFSSDIESMQHALKRARINQPVSLGPTDRSRTPSTRLYDAIRLTAQEKLGPEVGRKAIILLGDGFDEGSQTKEKEALEASHRGQVIIYAIGIADHNYGWRGARTLKKFSRETGGTATFPRKTEDLQPAFDKITTELRTQYLLSYAPTNRARDGKFRKIKIKVKRKGAKAYTRKGYYAAQD